MDKKKNQSGVLKKESKLTAELLASVMFGYIKD